MLVTPPAKAVTSAERTSGTSSMHAAARTRLKEKSSLLTTDHRPPARGWPCQILSSASSGERQSPQQRRAERHSSHHGRSLATSRGPGFPIRHDYSPFVGSALERETRFKRFEACSLLLFCSRNPHALALVIDVTGRLFERFLGGVNYELAISRLLRHF